MLSSLNTCVIISLKVTVNNYALQESWTMQLPWSWT